jgi:DNA-binding response OmpR family regulator
VAPNDTPPGPQNPENPSGDNAAPQGPIYPSIIFALTPTISREAVLKAFNGEGLTPIIVNSGDEMVEAVRKPEVFLIIVDVEFNDKRGLAFHQQLKGSTLSFWIALAKKLTTNQRSSLYAQGFADVLTHPVHPVLFKSRARMLLARFTKTNDFPDYVVLPPGIARKTPLPTKAANTEGDTKNAGGAQGIRQSNSNNQNNNSESIRVKGSGQPNEGPEWNIHSSQNPATDGSSVKVVKGSDSNAPDWNHNNSGGEDPKAEWRNKISPNENGPEGETKFFKKDDPQGSWNNKISPNEAQPGAETKFFAKDPASEINHHKSQSEPNTSVLSEKKPQTVIQSENKTLPANSTKPQPSQAPAKPRAEMTLDMSPGSFDLTRSKEPPPKRPSKTLGQIREKILELKSNVDWDQKLWPKDKLPKGSNLEICSRGLKKCITELEVLFKEAAVLLKSDRITLISLKPDALPKSSFCPEDLYALCSNDGRIKINDEVPSIFFPQIEVAFERRKAVLLNEPVEDPIDGKPRPADWKINGKIEACSAVFPVFLDSKPYAVLFIQFEEKADDARIKIIEQAVSFLGLPETHYSQVDFLSRIYRSHKLT